MLEYFSMTTTTQLLIIGAGPGGYAAAFHAADQGFNVTLIDQETAPGGACLYRGCIPSKALLHAARLITDSEEAAAIGLDFTRPTVQAEKLLHWKNSVVSKLTSGLGQLTKARKISLIQGTASFVNDNLIDVLHPKGTSEQISFEKAILATGALPVSLACLPDSKCVWNSTQALDLPFIPESLLIIGGGYIGLELGTAYAAFGSSVTIVETMPQLLGSIDRDLSDILIRRLKKTFVKIMTGTTVLSAVEGYDGLTVQFQNDKGEIFSETFSQALVSAGRKPNTAGLRLENTSVATAPGGFIPVNEQYQTSCPHIYAIGDIIGQPMLAHKASFDAKSAVAAMSEKPAAGTFPVIPSVIFTNPELAWAGITEAEARKQNLNIKVFKFPWAASGRALTIDRTDGLTKVIADAQTRRILGVGIVGVSAGDMIAEGVLAITNKLTADEMAKSIHAHPTLSETLMETAEGLFGHCTHMLSPKRN